MIVVAVALWLVLAGLILTCWSRINASTPWRVGALVLTLGFSLAHQLVFATVAEDAYITFRYSLNISLGNGAVFNPGERVEGYSNFLWMILIALPKTLFGADIVGTAAVLGVLCTLAAVVLVYFLVNQLVALAAADSASASGPGPLPGLGVVAAVLTAAASGLAAYGPAGLETPLFLLLILATLYALATRHPVIAGVLIALATMSRPDGLVFAVLCGSWLLLAALRRRTSWWSPAGYVLGALVFAVPWTAWRLTYYGYLTPNAVAAKSGGSFGWQVNQGWHYLSDFAGAHHGYLLLGLLAVAGLLRHRLRDTAGDAGNEGVATARSLVWLVFALVLVYLAFVTYTGGDWMPAWRMLVPVPPLLAVGIVGGYGVLVARSGIPAPETAPRGALPGALPGVLVSAAALVLCGLSLLTSTTNPRTLASMHDWRYRIGQMSEIGSWLGQRLPAGTVISTYANGALSYEAGARIIVVDVLGLTDEHIAREGKRDETAGPIGHIASDYGYVTGVRRPALAVTTGNGYAPEQRCAPDPGYGSGYRVATFRREGSTDWIAVYPRADQAATLIAQLDADPRFTYVPCP